MSETVSGSCKKTTCNVTTSGVCEDGHINVEECSNFTSTEDLTVEAEDPSPTIEGAKVIEDSEEIQDDVIDHETGEEDKDHSFHHGRYLDLTTSRKITAEYPTQIIVVAGSSDSGKTTLLASIYDLFQIGQFDEFIFSGSSTLPGFEMRCHLARSISGGLYADTERTKTVDRVDLLHLRVLQISPHQDSFTDLLFTDLSGERFEIVKNSTSECRKLTVLARADHFAILIDGEKIIDPKRRQMAFMDGRSMLRSGLDAEMLGKHTYIEVVFSKWDLIEPDGSKTEHTSFVSHIEENIKEEFGESFCNIDFCRVAARPKENSNYQFGHNLNTLFPVWVNYTPDRKPKLTDQEILPKKVRNIDQFSTTNNPDKVINGN